MTKGIDIAPAKGKLGVLLVGLGAVATTTIAGVFAIRKGLAKPIGSLTEMGTIRLGKRTDNRTPTLREFVPLAELNDLVFGGWDIFEDNVYESAKHAGVLEDKLLDQIKDEMSAIKPMSAVFDRHYVKRLDGPNVKKGKNKKDLADQLIADIRNFKKTNNCDRLVMVWTGSTEIYMTPAPCHQSLAAFEKGLLESDPAIPSSMIYAYAAISEGIPHANAAPNLSADVPALFELAQKTGSPLAGSDMKTGQTLIKTIIAPGLKARLIGVEGWYSTNILGNRDGEVLDDPESFKTKEESKKSALDYIFQPHLYPDLYKDLSHVVRINYYPPRGDNKEGWDNIDIFGWLGYKMQLKINFLCRDSILAAPIVLDVAIFMDLAKRAGMKGIQEWLSFYFKNPMHAEGLYPEHDLFIQLMKLKNTLRYMRGEELITHLGREYYDEMEIDALLDESRRFAPSEEWRKHAQVNDPEIYARAAADPEAFWAGFASELEWIKPWDRVLDWQPPHAKWFVGGKLNASANCLDRHIRTARRNKAALIWEGEPGDRRTLTYFDLYRDVSAFANVLKKLGVKKGDRVALYMPLIPELAIAMLACARIGAVHSVVFGGFSAESLRDRINDSQCVLLVTADGGYRRGQIVPLKQTSDEALKDTPSIQNVVVVQRRAGDPIPAHMQEGRDHWYHRLMEDAALECEPEPMDSEDMLYILYTSGTTGKPKGIVHTTGGYLTITDASTKWVFDLREDDVYWCTADIGWVTGHSYVVYGPLANGATVVMYEGAPDWPQKDRFWKIIERFGVTVFYTAPTAIRAFMKWGAEWPAGRNLNSLRLLGSVGEPINPEAWMWYQEHIGHNRCPIVDTWWQTETGQILITPLPGITTTKPGSATQPFPGISAEIRTASGERVTEGGGLLALTRPWPAMLRGIYGDPQRYIDQYWTKWKDGVYFTGDGARVDSEGYYWLLGRVDDVLNVAGHRLGTMEVESALVDHPAVAEAAVVGCPHEIKGQGVAAFVTLKEGRVANSALIDELKEHVVKKIGAIARPDQILFAADLPKTRSGKIMRRLLRDIAEGKALGDTTTLADPNVVRRLKDEYESIES